MIPEQISQPHTQQTRSNKTQQRIGLCLLVAPIALFVITLILYAMANFFFSQPSILESTTTSSSLRSMVIGVLTLTGMLSIVGILLGIPLGVFLLAQKDTPTQPPTV